MYCGHDLADTIDHFVPVDADPLRAFCWHNHLLACGPCNSRYKGAEHRTDAFGQPLLIDPTCEDPFDHLHLHLQAGMFEGITPRGEYTIRVCGLNDANRVLARTRAFAKFRLLLTSWLKARREGDASGTQYFVVIRTEPFASVCQALLRQASSEHAEILLAGEELLLSICRDTDVREALLLLPPAFAGVPRPRSPQAQDPASRVP